MGFDTHIVNWTEAHELINSIDEPVTKKILETSLGILAVQFVLTDDETNETLPSEPFDALFYLRLIQQLFKNDERMIQLLNGNLSALDDFDIGDDK